MTEFEYKILYFLSPDNRATGVDIANHFLDTCSPADTQKFLKALFENELISSDKGFDFNILRSFKLTPKGRVALMEYTESRKHNLENQRKKNHSVADHAKKDQYKVIETVVAVVGAVASLLGILEFFLN